MNNSNVDKTIYKHDNFDKVFSFLHLYKSANKCAKNVGWKASVQKYNMKRCINVANTLKKLKSSTYKSKPFYSFTKVERGKPRLIRSNHISDRVVQKCLCNYSLVPTLRKKIIYDNCATLKHRGCEFAINRTKLFMRKQTQPFYTLTMDFHSYFENIDHTILLNEIFKYYTDKRIKIIIYHFIKMFGNKGLGLGSQVSQICAVFYPHAIDNYVKHIARHKYFVRYMDDSIVIDNDKNKLNKTLSDIKVLCDKYKIELNFKKTMINNSQKGCNFLKRHWNKTNKLYVKPMVDSYYRMFRKLKKFIKWKLDISEIQQSFESWKSHFIHDNAKKLLIKATIKYNKLKENYL